MKAFNVPFLFLAGCISAPIQIPQKECKRVDLPPVPQKAYLDIQGDKILSDKGGEAILRGYVQARSSLGAR